MKTFYQIRKCKSKKRFFYSKALKLEFLTNFISIIELKSISGIGKKGLRVTDKMIKKKEFNYVCSENQGKNSINRLINIVENIFVQFVHSIVQNHRI